MKKIFFFFVLSATFLNAGAQSEMIIEVFRLLPADKIYGLSLATRDSMLSGKTYYPPDNDSASVVAFNHGISINENDYMYVDLSYETSQRASSMIEIRSFKTKTGDHLILVSETGGVLQINYQQNELSAFMYKDKKLLPYTKKLFPVLDESVFMKRSAPDSVKQLIRNNSNMTYDLSKKRVMFALNSQYLMQNPVTEKWIKRDYIEFKWNGKRFIKN